MHQVEAGDVGSFRSSGFTPIGSLRQWGGVLVLLNYRWATAAAPTMYSIPCKAPSSPAINPISKYQIPLSVLLPQIVNRPTNTPPTDG